MARYAIGDIHGCYDEFMQLLKEIDFNSGKDTLYLVGDIVNRGPKSVEVLDWVLKNSNNVISILGNHEIYFLLRYNGVIPSKGDIDFLDPIFATKRIKMYIDYIRSCPCIFFDSNTIFAHAGIYPKLHLTKILEANYVISAKLNARNYSPFLEHFYKSFIISYQDDHNKMASVLFALKSSTQMRYLLTSNGNLNFSYKLKPENSPDYLIPWFEMPLNDSLKDKKIVFGHWAALGLFEKDNIICLDSGCVWGNQLTVMNIDTGEIKQVQAHHNYIGK